MDEGPSYPAARRSGVATGTPSGNNIEFAIEFAVAVIRSGRGRVRA
jgi:hypothetical protein